MPKREGHRKDDAIATDVCAGSIVTLQAGVTPPSDSRMARLDGPVEGLPGIATRRAAAYAAAGIQTRRHLLYHLPVRYRVRLEASSCEDVAKGEAAALVGTVQRTSLRRRGRRSTVTLRLIDDHDRSFLVLLFNRAYLARSLARGTRLWASGKVGISDDGVVRLLASDYERLQDEKAMGPDRSLLPIYRLPPGVPPKVHRRAVSRVLEEEELTDWRGLLPTGVSSDVSTPSLEQALWDVHCPEDLDQARCGKKRLAWDEAFSISLDVARRRGRARPKGGISLIKNERRHRSLLARLPHRPTPGQARAIEDIRVDLSSAADDRPMSRLVQGDVGSGKTMVAFYALLAAVEAGHQAALMAPTEILAEQHLESLSKFLAASYGDRAPRIALITGGGSAAFRTEQRRLVASGEAPLAVGTHGLQSKPVQFAHLAVTVVDEQHRFGVRQRVRFRNKGDHTHLLVMTATPIPRTLALTAYGELDISVVEGMPPGRLPRSTVYLPPGRQEAFWRSLGKAVSQGERGYVVCPSIGGRRSSQEEEDGLVHHSVKETLARIREFFGEDIGMAGVHGRMPAEQRNRALHGFRTGEIQILVATVLIEVGLDVPEATFVVIPDPSRFGLATLHQIRGRVGRGKTSGRCYLLGPLGTQASRARVAALVESEDGFVLAEKDLELRGPGEMLGVHQSGMPSFHVLDPVADVGILTEARAAARTSVGSLDQKSLSALEREAFPLVSSPEGSLLAGG
ncbi:MAG: ATP-dependent DNA helicase RecG [Planctomycetota bacterium]|nr:ATP-dependent DNA helicase RecG [Planctomycetota bacterium]